MNREELETSAAALVQVSAEAASEYGAKREALVAAMNALMLTRPDLDGLVGESNRDMMRDNHGNHARFMESMFLRYDPKVLVETVLWVFRAYRSHGFRTTYWSAELNTWVELLKQELGEASFSAIYPFYNWLIVNLPVFVALTEEQVQQALARD